MTDFDEQDHIEVADDMADPCPCLGCRAERRQAREIACDVATELAIDEAREARS